MFTGFSDATIDFLWELRFHNERPWFLEHKQVFLDTLDRPMKALAADVTAALEQAYPQRKWYLHVARIYRDARRLHGSGPYKENLWFTLRCDSSRGPEIPAFYFEITPHNYSYGMGCYWAKANTMACFRRAIDADPLPLTALAERLLATEEARNARTISVTDMIAKLGPMFGLLGTLIPLGPGIVALGQGDTVTLSESMNVAFDTTIAGVISAAVASVISHIRKRWYNDDMVSLETLMEAVLEEVTSDVEG